MQLPDLSSTTSIKVQLSEEEIVNQTVAQIMKDFALFGIEINFSGDTSQAYDELFKQLVSAIDVLVTNDYGRLLSILYQVDITEKEIAKTERDIPDYNHHEVIAHQIIVRDLKKVLIRNYYKNNPF